MLDISRFLCFVVLNQFRRISSYLRTVYLFKIATPYKRKWSVSFFHEPCTETLAPAYECGITVRESFFLSFSSFVLFGLGSKNISLSLSC